MSEHSSGHAQFEELAAGYALDALEPADEQRFLRHARGCPQCTHALAGYREVAVMLALAAPAGEPSPSLASRVASLAQTGAPAEPGPNGQAAETSPNGRTDESSHNGQAAHPGPNGPADPGPNVRAADPGPGSRDLASWRPGTRAPGSRASRSRAPRSPRPGGHASRSRRWRRVGAVAAVVALLATGGTWAGLEATSPAAPPGAALCAHGCSQVVLTAAGSHRATAKVVVSHGFVWLEPGSLPPDGKSRIYVLWQLTRDSRPIAVGSFDVRAGAGGPVLVGPLTVPYDATLAFAVSLEHGRSIPATPTHMAALGQTS